MELTPQERTTVAAVALLLALGAALRHSRLAPAPAPSAPAGPPPTAAPVAPRSAAARVPPRLDPNRADARALDALPGIGPTLAQRIVAERERGGPYRSLADLGARVPGLGPTRLARLAPHLALPAGAAGASATPAVDPNTADTAALAALPGIGPTLAHRIVAERERGGPYRSLADLAARVPGLGPARAQRLAPYLRFGSP